MSSGIVIGTADILLKTRDILNERGWQYGDICNSANAGGLCMYCALRLASTDLSENDVRKMVRSINNIMNIGGIAQFEAVEWRRQDHVIEFLTTAARIFHDIERSVKKYMTA